MSREISLNQKALAILNSVASGENGGGAPPPKWSQASPGLVRPFQLISKRNLDLMATVKPLCRCGVADRLSAAAHLIQKT
jgi:hypothetical protein